MFGDEKKDVLSPIQEFQAEGIISTSTGDASRSIKIFDIPSGLCFSCTHGFIYRSKKLGTQQSDNSYQISCQYTYSVSMPDDVDYCNKYNKCGQMGLNEMKDIATVIEIDKRSVGFAPHVE